MSWLPVFASVALDAADNRTAETTSDAAAVVKRQLTRVYDQLGRLEQQLDAQARATDFTYDANGNQTAIEDALGRLRISVPSSFQ